MNRNVLIFVCFLMLTLSLGSVDQVLACSCVRNVSSCQRFGFSDLIFVGKAIDVKNNNPKDDDGKELSIGIESTIFEVDEVILGENEKHLTIQNKAGTSCDVSFIKGETYLIFASGDQKKGYATGYCSGNLSIDQAAQTLNELRNLPSPGTGGKLYGSVYENLRKSHKEFVPMPSIPLRILEVGGRRKVYTTITDGEGNYHLTVPQGKYRIIPTIPLFATLGIFSDDPVLVKDRGCVEKRFAVSNDAQLSGKVVDVKGNPVIDIRVDLIAVDDENPQAFGDESASTDEMGMFTIEDIPAGRYTLSVNYTMPPNKERPYPTTFYPNALTRENAKIIEIKLGKQIGGLVVSLPPKLDEESVSGSVVWEEGSPVAGASVYLEDSEDLNVCANGCDNTTNSSGSFELTGFRDRQYRIKARFERTENGQPEEYEGQSELFLLTGDVSRLKLVLTKRKIQ